MPITYADSFSLVPQKALAWFRGKGLRSSFFWDELLRQEHDTAFTVAKLMDLDLLADIQTALTLALSDGMTLTEFKANITPILKARGWWGKTDAGELGSPRRLETIFRTNLQTAYAEQYWDTIQKSKADRPYLMYSAIDDSRVRPEHLAWDNLILPVDDPFWDTHYPPNGWNCRCTVIQLDAEDVARLGFKVSASPSIKYYDWENPNTGLIEKIPVGIDPAWDYNPGAGRAENLRQVEARKMADLPAGFVG